LPSPFSARPHRRSRRRRTLRTATSPTASGSTSPTDVCHGRAGQGGAYTGPAPALARTGLPFDGFKAQIRDPSDNMPAYSDAVLSDKDIADIYAFVESLPAGRSAKDISILDN
jgi:hypothetical protein